MSKEMRAKDGTYPTTCWECSTCCGALATVRDGRVTEFAPNQDHPYSKGAFCIKGIRGAPGITYGEKRLLYPMRRMGGRGEGKWARISWEEALDEMAERLAAVRQSYGPEAIVGATSGAYFSRSLILALTLRSIGSPNWMINQDLCGGCRAVSARTTGLNITRGEDIDKTRCALIVGRNSSIADPVEWAALKAAKKRGARLVVVDPKRTQAAQMADLWLAPRVGTDAALALAMTHVLISDRLYDQAFVARWCHGFDELAERAAQFTLAVAAGHTGVPADQIVAAARMYADGPSTFVSGHGIDAFSAGVQTFRAYHCLVAISGNVDRPGGNLRMRHDAVLRRHVRVHRLAEQPVGTPTTATSRTPGAACSTSSISRGTTFSPPDLIRSSRRPDEVQVALLVRAEEVAGGEHALPRPASRPQALGGRLRVVPVALHDVGAADHQLAHLARTEHVPRLVLDPRLACRESGCRPSVGRASSCSGGR